MQVIVNQLLTSYSQAGKGSQTILFLHGWGDSGKTFESLAKELGSDYQTVIVDLPGFGGSGVPKTAWGLDEYAAFAAAFCAKIKCRPNVIVGHSNGGAIAIHGLANNTLQADKLILIASAGIRQASFKKAAFSIAAKPAKLAIAVLPKGPKQRIRRKMYAAIGSDYLVAEHMQATFKRIVTTDVSTDASRLKLPVCLIYGESDTATPVAYAKTLHALIEGSSLDVIPTAGHFVHQEQVYKVSRIIKEFIV